VVRFLFWVLIEKWKIEYHVCSNSFSKFTKEQKLSPHRQPNGKIQTGNYFILPSAAHAPALARLS
jgi:hypothetical protein